MELEQPIRVLDLCAGTLDLTQSLLRRYPLAQCTCVDFSQAMLQAGAGKIPEPQREQVSLLCADALDLPLDNNSFDTVICGYGFRNLADKPKGLAEIHRVLKIGGRVLILDFFRPTNPISSLFHHTYGTVVLPLLGKWISKHPDAYTYLKNSIQDFYSLSEGTNAIRRAGFVVKTARHLAGGISSFIIGEKMP